jgi:hypothetical protein
MTGKRIDKTVQYWRYYGDNEETEIVAIQGCQCDEQSPQGLRGGTSAIRRSPLSLWSNDGQKGGCQSPQV